MINILRVLKKIFFKNGDIYIGESATNNNKTGPTDAELRVLLIVVMVILGIFLAKSTPYSTNVDKILNTILYVVNQEEDKR